MGKKRTRTSDGSSRPAGASITPSLWPPPSVRACGQGWAVVDAFARKISIGFGRICKPTVCARSWGRRQGPPWLAWVGGKRWEGAWKRETGLSEAGAGGSLDTLVAGQERGLESRRGRCTCRRAVILARDRRAAWRGRAAAVKA